MSLDEAKQRCIELSVKNSVSFMSREKELIGKVCVFVKNYLRLQMYVVCLNIVSSFVFQLQIGLNQLDLKAGLTQWYVHVLFSVLLTSKDYLIGLRRNVCLRSFFICIISGMTCQMRSTEWDFPC